MRLSTRIASFEWLLVGLLVGVSALSVRLLSSETRRASTQIRAAHHTAQVIGRMKQALWAHEVAEERVRLGEGRVQQIGESREAFTEASRAALDLYRDRPERAAVAQLITQAQRYFRGDASLEVTLRAFEPVEEASEGAVTLAIERELAAGRTGVTLIASIGAVALLAAILLAARASRRVSQPLDVLHRTAVALADGRSTRRVPDGDFDETIRELGHAINQLADRLEDAQRGTDLGHALLESGADALIERATVPTLILDLSGRPRLTNASARRLLERSSLEALGVSAALDRVQGTNLTPGEPAGQVEAVRLIARRGTAIGFLVRLPPQGVVEA